MSCTFFLYGCQLFEPPEEAALPSRRRLARGAGGGGNAGGDGGASVGVGVGSRTDPSGNTDEFVIAWAFSAFQRFVMHEPMLILASKGLPILFATECCANCCGESIVNLLSLVFEVIAAAIQQLKA